MSLGQTVNKYTVRSIPSLDAIFIRGLPLRTQLFRYILETSWGTSSHPLIRVISHLGTLLDMTSEQVKQRVPRPDRLWSTLPAVADLVNNPVV